MLQRALEPSWGKAQTKGLCQGVPPTLRLFPESEDTGDFHPGRELFHFADGSYGAKTLFCATNSI